MALGHILVCTPYSKHKHNFFNFLRKEKFQNIPFCYLRLWLLSSQG